MNEAKHLLELKTLYQICAEQINIILTAETKAERDNAEEYLTTAFHCILKIIKAASEKEINNQTSHADSKNDVAQKLNLCIA